MNLNRKGYSVIKIDSKNYYTHRVIVHLLSKFKLDSKKPILHNDSICSDRACIEFDHLRVGTYTENSIDTINKLGHNNAFGRRRMYCPQGHEYNTEIVSSSTGAQICVTCRKESNRKYRVRVRNEKRRMKNEEEKRGN